MWQPFLRRNVVPEEDVCEPFHTHRQQPLASSSSQVSLSYTSQRSLARSQSLGSVNHQSSGLHRGTRNETFRLGPYFAPHLNGSPATCPDMLHPPLSAHPPKTMHRMTNMQFALLGNSVRSASSANSLFAAQVSAPAPTKPLARNSSCESSVACSSCSDDDSSLHPQSLSSYHQSSRRRPLGCQPVRMRQVSGRSSPCGQSHHSASGSVPSLILKSSKESLATEVSVASAMPKSNNSCQTGPSKLYRLIASPPHGEKVDWDVILQRAISHPHEACFFDPNGGGHVYALHRLLRRTGMDPECRPPYEVVEAVMQACPRAVTRKQAVLDEDDEEYVLLDEGHSSWSTVGMVNIERSPQQSGNPLLVLNLPLDGSLPQQATQQNTSANEDNSNASAQHQGNNNVDHDDVRFEYPLAIACECEQDGEIVRLIASSVWKTKPVYRSEVFRSLDYASLPNPIVRILLEEYAGCVLERGTDSEANEGDDDDCPLEKVLFWWDDPDMMGMEDDIENYPNCNMKDDLCDLCEKLRMMLYAAAMGTMAGYDDSKKSFKVLHHALRIVSNRGIGDVHFPNDFTHAIFLLAKFIQREDVAMFQERDETGALPLHIAVSGKGLFLSDDQHAGEGAMDEREDATVDNPPLEQADQNDEIINGMVGRVDENSEGAQADIPALALEDNGAPVDEPPILGGDNLDEEAEDNDDERSEGENDMATSSLSPSMEIIRLLLDQHPTSIRLRDSQTGSLPVHLALQRNPQATDIINHFLDIYPRCVTMPDGNGRLPIHVALTQRSPVWEKILAMSPNTLETRDPVTGLFPFQLASMSESLLRRRPDSEETIEDAKKELESLSICYRLLRMSPCLASGLAEVKPRPQSLIERQIMARYKPRVTKLEEENEKLRQKVEELQSKLLSLQMMNECDSPVLKKRKSSAIQVASCFEKI